MDLYRFFHPHHNPRLRNTPLRLQELSELELAAKELSRAIERAKLRLESSDSDIPAELLSMSSEAIDLAKSLLKQMVEIYPEDSKDDMKVLLKERSNAPGWEAWCQLLKEQLEISKCSYSSKNIQKNSLSPSKSAIRNDSDIDDSSSSVSTSDKKKIFSA